MITFWDLDEGKIGMPYTVISASLKRGSGDAEGVQEDSTGLILSVSLKTMFKK